MYFEGKEEGNFCMLKNKEEQDSEMLKGNICRSGKNFQEFMACRALRVGSGTDPGVHADKLCTPLMVQYFAVSAYTNFLLMFC